MKENRSETRFEICLAARWQGSGTRHDVRISDLSRAGCYVDTIVQVNVGETLFLQLLMPDGIWVELPSVVARHSPGLGFGVRFINHDEQQQHQIQSLLRIQNSSLIISADTFECRETFIPFEQIDLTSRVSL